MTEKTCRRIIDYLKSVVGQAGSGDGDYLPEDCDYMKKMKLRQKGNFRNLSS